MDTRSSALSELEDEAMYVVREAAAEFSRLALLFSGGKDSIVLSWIARKAFFPAGIPFPLLHIDTGHNFPETLEFRDWFMDFIEASLIVKTVQESIDAGRAKEEKGPNTTRNRLQSVTLMDAVRDLRLDAVFGGARRDEEKARAKERFFSFRNEFGVWDPKNQRPELWGLFNMEKGPNDHFRVFPLSNWTEMDVWRYIVRERIPIPSLYLAHDREVVRRDGTILARSPYVSLLAGERWERMSVRFRTIGDMTCTGATQSEATDLQEVVRELLASTTTERGGRADDRFSDTAMEDRKKQGYF